MTRSVVIHQPNYLPWIGLFSKVSLADCFIIYDCAQYTTHGVINRNKIRSSSGPLYLTIPVNRSFRSSKINEVLLPENNRWQNDHWQSTYVNYAKSLYFKDYQET